MVSSQKRLSVGTLSRIRNSLVGRQSEHGTGLNSYSDHGENSSERNFTNGRFKLERSSFSTGDIGKASSQRENSYGRSLSITRNKPFAMNDRTKKVLIEASGKKPFKYVSFSRKKPETNYTFRRQDLTHLEAIRYWVQPEEMEKTTDRCWDIIDEREEQARQGSKAIGLCTRGLERYISERRNGKAMHQTKRQDAYVAVLEWAKGMSPEEIARRYEIVSKKCMRKAVEYGRRDAEIAERILTKERNKWEQWKRKTADTSDKTFDEEPRVLLSRSSRTLTDSMYGNKKESPYKNSAEATYDKSPKEDNPAKSASEVAKEETSNRIARRNSGSRRTRRSLSNGRRPKSSSSRPRKAKSTTEVASLSTTDMASPGGPSRRRSVGSERPRRRSISKPRRRRSAEMASNSIGDAVSPNEAGIERRMKRSSLKPLRRMSMEPLSSAAIVEATTPTGAGKSKIFVNTEKSLSHNDIGSLPGARALGSNSGDRAHTIHKMLMSNTVWEIERQD